MRCWLLLNSTDWLVGYWLIITLHWGMVKHFSQKIKIGILQTLRSTRELFHRPCAFPGGLGWVFGVAQAGWELGSAPGFVSLISPDSRDISAPGCVPAHAVAGEWTASLQKMHIAHPQGSTASTNPSLISAGSSGSSALPKSNCSGRGALWSSSSLGITAQSHSLSGKSLSEKCLISPADPQPHSLNENPWFHLQIHRNCWIAAQPHSLSGKSLISPCRSTGIAAQPHSLNGKSLISPADPQGDTNVNLCRCWGVFLGLRRLHSLLLVKYG